MVDGRLPELKPLPVILSVVPPAPPAQLPAPPAQLITPTTQPMQLAPMPKNKLVVF